LNSSVYWFQIGRFEDNGVWKVDKHQISAILQQEVEDNFLHVCPSFDRKVLDEAINRLPDLIDVHQSPSWEVLYENKVEGSKIAKKAVGVIHKLTLNTLIEPRKNTLKKEISDSVQKSLEKDSKSNTESKKRSIPAVSFSEIGGIESILQTIREVIELPLKNPALFDYLNIKPHKGILLFGPPGCGKTMIAKAIANEIQAHFISVKGPELLNKYYGQSEENLRSLFEEASELQPSIIFFDEIDAIAQKRSSEDNLRIEAKFVNQFLTMMDGIEDYGSVCVIAATNRPELLDSALLRPGRFDYQLNVPKPDKDGCKKIFEINTKKMPVHEEFNSESFSESLEGLTGAEIAFVAREGAYNCLRRNYTFDPGNFETMSQLKEFNHLKIAEIDFQEALKRIKN
jgi:SpoVK/Ycf46/Vps4 family AAA+-type ATPase